MRTSTAAFLVLVLAGPIFAQGIVEISARHHRPHRPPHHVNRTLPVRIKRHHVDVTIESAVATTRVTQVFANPNAFQLEGSYVFPIPDAASITRFTMVMNGKTVHGEVLEKDKARAIYEGIVRSMRDPALLEYVGRDLFRARVFPIPARGDVEISLTYVQELEREGGIHEFRYPLRTQPFSKERVDDLAVAVTIRERAAIRSVFSSSHEIDVVRKSETEMRASLEGKRRIADRDLHLFYTVSDDDIGLHLLTHPEKGAGGHFMLKVAPKLSFDDVEIAARDLVFVVDTSGSMQEDGKIEQAKRALIHGLSTLREVDRFNIVTFATEARRWRDAPIAATPAAKAEAIAWVKKIRATGGTNIDEALRTGFTGLEEDRRLHMVVFLTDGLPTVGETDEKRILANAVKANGADARLFVFGVGYDVNVKLLDTLAERGRGARDYVTQGANLEVVLSTFFDRIAHPVLTDVELLVEGVTVSETYPRKIGDLFKGSEITVLGRHAGSGNAVIRLRGMLGGGKREFVYEKKFGAAGKGRDFIPILWAKRKVGYLWDQIRLHGENRELKNEIVRLGKHYAIATPYTSILVQEDTVAQGGGRTPRRGHWERRRRGGLVPPPPGAGGVDDAPGEEQDFDAADSDREVADELGFVGGATAGEKAVRKSLLSKKLKEADGPQGEEIEAKRLGRRRIKGRTFVRKGERWIEESLTSGRDRISSAVKVRAWTPEYFRLIRTHPEAGAIIAALREVVLVLGDEVYRITEKEEAAPASRPLREGR